MVDIARSIREKADGAFDDKTPEALGPQFARTAMDVVLEWHKASMEKFGIRFDNFYRETELMESGYFMATIETLRAAGAIEERDGASFYVQRTSPVRPMSLVRTPGFRAMRRQSPWRWRE